MLDVADGEVTSKMGRLDPLLDWEVELATEATIARAVELWQEGEVPFGMVGLDNPTGPAYLPRKSRALAKLLPAQQSWGSRELDPGDRRGARRRARTAPGRHP